MGCSVAVTWRASRARLCIRSAKSSTTRGLRAAQVFSRDGHEKGEFKRGDMYLRDLKNTKGHVTSCTHGAWHPSERHTALTSSTDGTLRVWDTEALAQRLVIKPSVSGGGRVPATACCYSPDGALIAGALRLAPPAAR